MPNIINVKNTDDFHDTTAEVVIQNNIDYIPKVSVIIPVYNTEKYLRKCLDSVVNQTLKEIEIICVDDGSTDSSLDILKEYASKDNRITVLKQENLYAGVARNAGLAVAKGEYLSFLDSDDYFEENMQEELFNTAIKNNSEIVICDTYLFDEKENIDKEVEWTLRIDKIKDIKCFNYKDVKDNIFKLSNCWVWSRLYNKDFVDNSNLKFQALRSANDTYFSCIAMVLATRISCLPKRLIHYRINQISANNVTSVSSRISKPCCLMYSVKSLYDALIQFDLYKDVYKSYMHMTIDGIYWTKCGIEQHEASYNEFCSYFSKNFRDIFNIKTEFLNIETLKKYQILNKIFDLKETDTYKLDLKKKIEMAEKTGTIPKIIHYCWFGGNKKHYLIQHCINSWKKFLPDYKLIEWNDEDLKACKNPYVIQAAESKKWAFVSDYFRVYALYTYGGVYLDSDNEIFKSLDPFLNLDFFSGFELWNNKVAPFTAVVGAKKGNKILADWLRNYENINFKENGKLNLETNTSKVRTYFQEKYNLNPPYDGTKEVELEKHCILFPYNYFCDYKKGVSYAVHHFCASWNDAYNPIVKKKSSFLGLNLYKYQIKNPMFKQIIWTRNDTIILKIKKNINKYYILTLDKNWLKKENEDSNSFIEKIFSVTNSCNKSHKVITILGLKIKFRRKNG